MRNNSLWVSAHTSFSVSNATNFYRFWGIIRNNNCHCEMAIGVFPGHISPSLMCVTAHWAYQCPIFNCSASVHLHFALECSSVFTYLYMAHDCAIPSIMFYQHICNAFCLWNYLSLWIISVTFIFIYRMIHPNAVCSPLVFISFNNFKTGVLYLDWFSGCWPCCQMMRPRDETQCVEEATEILFCS